LPPSLSPPHAPPQESTAAPPTGQLRAAVEGDTYERRAHFAKGVERMSARLDEQIRRLRANRAATTSDTKDGDFATKEVA
jgi:hypothetical protein